jgi:glutamine amidotransferase
VGETIVIIDYGSGNLRSVEKAFLRSILDERLDCHVEVSSDPDKVIQANRVVLPGVGAFADCMNGLKNIAGMRDALCESVIRRGRPFLGICVGMQLLADEGFEHGRTEGLGWVHGDVVPIVSNQPQYKVPHMGWNEVVVSRPHPVLGHLAQMERPYAYFVHSYRFRCASDQDEIAWTEHGEAICAAIGHDNIFGTQFHPEKSQALGLALLGNFIRWRP